MLALSIKGVSKTYPNGTKALKSIDLDVKKGQFLALLGKNGAGKTTLVEILSSLNNKTAGKVIIQGKDIDKDSAFVKASIGIVPQEINLAIFEKVLQVLVWQAGYFGIDNKTALKRAEKHLKALDLWDKREQRVITLSGGMKRRLMIARALMHEPEIIFLDEPTAGVDIEIRHSIWTMAQELNQAGKTIILTTHYFEEAEKLCDSLAIISNGKIVMNDSLIKVFNKCPGQKYIIELEGQLNVNIKHPNINALPSDKLEVTVDKKISLIQIIEKITANGGKIKNIQPKNSRLEELFLNIVG
jgi:ABC-2 type transport system ATP-binding protein